MRIRFLTAISLIFIHVSAACAAGKFSHELAFTLEGCQKAGWCKLKSKFGYIDSEGQGWEAEAGNLTDGASIPKDLKPYFGNSFDPELVRAAVIHDHYCDRRVRSWYTTHWVFYDALMASGVKQSRAELMLLGVLIGGPKWIWLTEGKTCTTGKNCIFQVPTAKLPDSGAIQSFGIGGKMLYRGPRYDSPEFQKEMEIAAGKLEKLAPGQKPEVLLELAKSVRPTDEFINGPEEIVLPSSLSGGVDK